MARASLLAGGCAALSLTVGTPAQAEWTKTWVVEWNEPAMYYGAEDGTIEPGTDCPAGANPSPDWIQVLMDAGYTREEAEWLRDPANPTRSAVHGQPGMGFRGKDRQNVYDFPESTPEVGLPPVEGEIGEGIDLDGNPQTGFVSPSGARGIDNNFYKALGCWKTYRGAPRMSSGAQIENDGMREGAWTIVVVASGSGDDPMNDDDVRIGFYDSADKMVRDGMGNVASDYTFAIQPDRVHEAVFAGQTRNGRLTGKAEGSVNLRNPGYDRDLPLLESQVDFQMHENGTLTGMIGGYRPWLPVYKGWVAGRGPVIEVLTWVRLPDVYYALERHADYSPTGPGGDKTHISFALRVDAIPAFVMEPDQVTQVDEVGSYRVQTMDRPRTAQQAAAAPSAALARADLSRAGDGE